MVAGLFNREESRSLREQNRSIKVVPMESMELLLAANAVVWLGVCGYIAFLAGQTGRIRRRLQQLELKEESDARDDW